MDIATLCGLILGLIAIVGTIAYESGGNLLLFFNIPAMVIVIGGTVSATLVHFSMAQVMGIIGIIKKVFVVKIPASTQIIQQMVNYAAINRRDGALALEQEIRNVKVPFMGKALQMVVDGQDAEAIKEHLSMEIQYIQERHSMGKKILEFMGSACPMFAMVGTLIGLISMLSKMENPSEVGRGMAVALICTFYGAFTANMFFLPMAGKLGQYSKFETIMMEMITDGICAIANGENPTAVREKMQIFVSSKNREDVKAKV